MTLSQKNCVPCQGGIPALDAKKANQFLHHIPDWHLTHDATRIERHFNFDNFQQALDFANKVGAIAEEHMHHPDITFGWGYCTVVFYTHKIKGLHENDFIMAAKTDVLVAEV